MAIVGVSGRYSAPSFVSVREIMLHHCLLEKLCPITGVSERNYAPSLVSVREICILSVGEIVPQGTDKGKQRFASGPWTTAWRPLA